MNTKRRIIAAILVIALAVGFAVFAVICFTVDSCRKAEEIGGYELLASLLKKDVIDSSAPTISYKIEASGEVVRVEPDTEPIQTPIVTEDGPENIDLTENDTEEHDSNVAEDSILNTEGDVDWAKLREINPEGVGWICIEGTKINYPVAYSPKDSTKYLNTTFDLKEQKVGSIFCTGNVNFRKDANITIYGHTMSAPRTDMFSSLKKYKKKSFWEEHRTIRFDTIYADGTYEIFAVAVIENGTFNYRQSNFLGKSDFENYLNGLMELSLYDTGVTVTDGDRIITLSTCHGSSEKLVIAAVKR